MAQNHPKTKYLETEKPKFNGYQILGIVLYGKGLENEKNSLF